MAMRDDSVVVKRYAHLPLFPRSENLRRTRVYQVGEGGDSESTKRERARHGRALQIERIDEWHERVRVYPYTSTLLLTFSSLFIYYFSPGISK